MLFHYDMISVPLVYTQVRALLLGMLQDFDKNATSTVFDVTQTFGSTQACIHRARVLFLKALIFYLAFCQVYTLVLKIY